MKVLIISADNFEDTELLVPYYRLIEEGIKVDIVSIRKGNIKGKHGYQVMIDKTLEEVEPDGYDMLILPGGRAPEALKKERKAVEIVKEFFQKSKPISAICHGPQLLAAAGVLGGRHVTSYQSVADEMRDAAAIYEDKEVVVDGNLVTSRQPSDLPFFLRETMKILKGE